MSGLLGFKRSQPVPSHVILCKLLNLSVYQFCIWERELITVFFTKSCWESVVTAREKAGGDWLEVSKGEKMGTSVIGPTIKVKCKKVTVCSRNSSC